MADKIDPYDIAALEKAVNDSATRVSAIWISFLIFGLYLISAAGSVTHRQLFLEEPIKLPVLSIDLPFTGFWFLAPILFSVFHLYLLVQIVLLARTASAYNEALDRRIKSKTPQARIRQRIANTIFAQLFSGSPREREGLLGLTLRLMVWLTLAIAPVAILFVFEIKLLPYHSHFLTWSHRTLIALDLIILLLFWPSVMNAQQDIGWGNLLRKWKTTIAALVVVWMSYGAATFPGERQFSSSIDDAAPPDYSIEEAFDFNRAKMCRNPSLFGFIFQGGDRLSLQNEDFVDDKKFFEIIDAATKQKQNIRTVERTRNFRDRDLACANLSYADLRGVDLSGANMSGAYLFGANLQGASLKETNLQNADIEFANLQGALFDHADLRGANLSNSKLQGASLDFSKLWAASFLKLSCRAHRSGGRSLWAHRCIAPICPAQT